MRLKRVLAGALAACTALACVGCGDTANSGAANSGTTSSGAANSDAANSDAASSGANSGANSETNSGTESGGQQLEGGLTFDASKIQDGETLEVMTARTDRVSENDGGDGYFVEFVKEFEERYNCKVTFRALKDYAKDLKQMMSSGNYGDVLSIPDSGLNPKRYSDYFEVLGTVGDFKDVYRDVTNKAQGEGDEAVVYGLAPDCTVSGICYNKKVWADAGITELPSTVDDFIADLKKIREHDSSIIPVMCCYQARDWNLKEYTQYAPAVTGDPDFKTKLLVNGGDLFVKGEPYYETCRMMYEVYKDPDLHESSVNDTVWDTSKMMLAQGKVGTFIVGSWAINQFKQEGEKNGVSKEDCENVALMPVPIRGSDGKLHASVGADGSLAVNKNSSESKKELGKAFIKWWIEESDWAEHEGNIPTLLSGKMPEALQPYADLGVELFTQNPAPGDITTTFGDIDTKQAQVNIDGGADGNYKFSICELAMSGGTEDEFNQILKDMNTKWAAARDSNPELQAFLATDAAADYKDENYAKKADF